MWPLSRSMTCSHIVRSEPGGGYFTNSVVINYGAQTIGNCKNCALRKFPGEAKDARESALVV